ncbi:MAG: Hsp20/alpha crystallin family protein [Pseudomonadota bacterium]
MEREDPLRELRCLQETMNRLYEESVERGGSREELSARWMPPVDIYETGEAIVVQAELPGLSREDVQIDVQGGLLCIQGERKFQKSVEEGKYHRVERSYGAFKRSFPLPRGINADMAKAHFSNGLLEVVIPKPERPDPKQIKVEVD